jgi:hypothetical protein
VNRKGIVLLVPTVLLLLNCIAVCAPAPANSDDAVNLVLSVDNNGTRFSWELEYGQARQKALECLRAGQKEKALEAAKMQFILCPLESTSTELAMSSVKQMLTALDGNDARAKQFEEYAKLGPAGPDGKRGTADDLKDPVKDVALTDFTKPKEFYIQYDRTIDDRAAVSATWEKAWYETEKAYARLDGGDFDGAVDILIATLSNEVSVPYAKDDENWDLQKIQDIIDRIQAGLGVVYRGKTGTIAGVDAFIQACMDYAKYGPAGKDGRMGTADDLNPPM